jgi:hypothetical protein
MFPAASLSGSPWRRNQRKDIKINCPALGTLFSGKRGGDYPSIKLRTFSIPSSILKKKSEKNRRQFSVFSNRFFPL